jgi:urease accessory protein
VGASLEAMGRDARRMQGERPFLFATIEAGQGVSAVGEFLTRVGRLANRTAE